MNEKCEAEDSPNRDSQQIVSDDDEIDYSSKPEFYDPKVDEKEELWARKQRGGRTSDAVLSCPACFTTLCLDCQRHEKYVTQYRAMFVVNCRINDEEVSQPGSNRKRNRRGSRTEADSTAQTFKRVCCSVCSTDVGVIDEEEVYHFFNAIPSEA
ncbi:E2F-associated phosphoprotein [Perilla frutescens var. hirtella]|uniref:E2F-associated phosphoprotein n=1 Tax=Perilla frutescens var. hirtella TaxID=608512 RepID=A0AAD4JQP9_PERFH|nr:E2F-associated phosphoprotein [Perilla frutescens var. frutescens]KAH6837861.1 E2F-associated phosphoprotein [Perilla frutescens var. hirtella]